MDDEVGGVAPISDEQIEKLELSFGYSDDDYESLVNAFRNAWPSIICRLRSQAAEIAQLRQRHSAQIGLTCEMSVEADRLRAELAELRQARHDVLAEVAAERDAARAALGEKQRLIDGLMAASNNDAAKISDLLRSVNELRPELAETRRQLAAEYDCTDRLTDELAEAKREASSVKEWAERAAENYRVQHAEMSATIDTLRADLAAIASELRPDAPCPELAGAGWVRVQARKLRAELAASLNEAQIAAANTMEHFNAVRRAAGIGDRPDADVLLTIAGLRADLERVREEKVAESRRLDWLDAQLGGFDEDGFEIRFHCSTNPDWPLRQVVDAKMDEEQADREMDPS